MLPVTYEKYLIRRPQPSEEEVLKGNINWLIERLYSPDEEKGAVIRDSFLNKLGLKAVGDEAINWGDVGVSEVEKVGYNDYIVYIQEASSDCHHFPFYLEYWLKRWGWNVRVRTEW